MTKTYKQLEEADISPITREILESRKINKGYSLDFKIVEKIKELSIQNNVSESSIANNILRNNLK